MECNPSPDSKFRRISGNARFVGSSGPRGWWGSESAPRFKPTTECFTGEVVKESQPGRNLNYWAFVDRATNYRRRSCGEKLYVAALPKTPPPARFERSQSIWRGSPHLDEVNLVLACAHVLHTATGNRITKRVQAAERPWHSACLRATMIAHWESWSCGPQMAGSQGAFERRQSTGIKWTALPRQGLDRGNCAAARRRSARH